MKVIEQINKKYGSNSAYLLGDESSDLIPVIPSGSLKLDTALGVGGLPRGRIIEIYGMEASGKTTLCQHIIAEAQKIGGIAAFVDVEHALDPYWLEVCKVDIDKLIVSQPDSGEQALDIVEMYIRSHELDVVIVDSVAALTPRAEIEGEMGDAHMALQARLMSQAMRKLVSAVKDSKTTLIFTNQLRQNIGGWGNPETTTGGLALRFYASIRIELKKGEIIKDKDEAIGTRIKVTIRKNKVSPPFKVAELSIYYGSGIDPLSELIDYGVDLEIIEKGHAWFTIGDTKVAGRENLRVLLNSNNELLQILEDKVRMYLGLPIKRKD